MKKFLSIALVLVMVVGLFAGCAAPAEPEAPAAEAPAAEAPAAEAPAAEEEAITPLVVGYAPFNSKFSPFFISP